MKKNKVYRIFVIIIVILLIISTCFVVASFFIKTPEVKLSEEEYGKQLVGQNPTVVKALNYIRVRSGTKNFYLTYGKIDSYKKISQMLVGKNGKNYVKIEYTVKGEKGTRTMTYVGTGNGSIASGSVYDSQLSSFKASYIASNPGKDVGSIKTERHIEGKDLEILLKYWRGEYSNDGADSVQ